MVNNRKNSRKNRRNNISMRKRRNNISMRKRRNNINMMGGAELSMPSPVGDMSMKGPMNMSLHQGQQFADFHKNQHGGVLLGGPYPGIVTEEALIPANMAAAARTAPLNAALNEIKGMSDQAGGKRKGRKNRKNTMRKRRNNMSMRKRRNNMSMRKRRNNMSMRKRRNNMSMRKRRNNINMMGGAVLSPSLVTAPGLLLPSGLEAKAVSGMNAEWKLAENPRSFAPGL